MMHNLTYHPPAAGRETTRLVIITINDPCQKIKSPPLMTTTTIVTMDVSPCMSLLPPLCR